MTDVSAFVNQLQSVLQGTVASPANPVVTPVPVGVISIPSLASTAAPSGPSGSAGKKIKIMIVSTHTNQMNGYSKVAHNLIHQLSAHPWISVVHFGTQKMISADLGRPYPANVKVIDATALEKDKQAGFALVELPACIQSERPDVVLIYNDLSVICAYIEQIRKVVEQRFFKVWAYVDMTAPAAPPAMIDVLNRDVDRVFCFTKSWKEVIKSQGITRPVDVLPHAVDPAMFRAIPRDVARQTLGLPKDVFLFTSVNKNIPRKRLDLLIIAFVKVMTRFPLKNLFLLIVADKGDRGGFSLFDIFAREIKREGGTVEMFGNRMMITSKDTCYKDEDINLLYNCGDVNISCAEGEGFGLCTFESMFLGVPQIAPAIHGYTEYCTEKNSLLVKPTLRAYLPQAYGPVTGEVQMVNPDDVAAAMERYVGDDALRAHHAKVGRETCAAYTWESVTAVLVKRLQALREEDD